MYSSCIWKVLKFKAWPGVKKGLEKDVGYVKYLTLFIVSWNTRLLYFSKYFAFDSV